MAEVCSGAHRQTIVMCHNYIQCGGGRKRWGWRSIWGGGGGGALTISSAFIEEDIILTHENKLRGGFLPKPLNPPLHAYAHDVNAV